MFAILLISGCNNPSFKEESKAAVNTVKTTFNEKEKQTNKKSGKIHFYLPTGYSIKDQSPNNIILQNGSEIFILFINPQEERTSDVLYKSTVDQYEKLDINETFKNDNKYGFLTIQQLKDDDLNEVTIGVGGAKITTQVKTGKLNEDAKSMMQIVNSVKYPQETKE